MRITASASSGAAQQHNCDNFPHLMVRRCQRRKSLKFITFVRRVESLCFYSAEQTARQLLSDSFLVNILRATEARTIGPTTMRTSDLAFSFLNTKNALSTRRDHKSERAADDDSFTGENERKNASNSIFRFQSTLKGPSGLREAVHGFSRINRL